MLNIVRLAMVVFKAMQSLRQKTLVGPNGRIELEPVDLPAGTKVEIIVVELDCADRSPRLSRLTALLSEQTLDRLWNTPEEDEAWRDL